MEVAQSIKNPHGSFSEHFELELFKAYRALKALGCDYLYFLGKNSEQSFRFCTDESWIRFYHEDKILPHDPLKRIAETSRFLVLPWEQVSYLNPDERTAMNKRDYYGYFNGLTVARNTGQNTYIFAFSTELKNHNLSAYLLHEKIKVLESTIGRYIELFNQNISLAKVSMSSIM